jgi:hypothetical protein
MKIRLRFATRVLSVVGFFVAAFPSGAGLHLPRRHQALRVMVPSKSKSAMFM